MQEITFTYTVNIYRYKQTGANAFTGIQNYTGCCISPYSFVPINIYSVQSNRNLKDTTRYIQKNQIEPDTIKPEPEKGNRKKEFNFE